MADPSKEKEPGTAVAFDFIVTLRAAPCVPLPRLLTPRGDSRRTAVAAHGAKIVVLFELFAHIPAAPVQRVGVPSLVVVVLGGIVEEPDRVQAAREWLSHVANIVEAPPALPVGAVEPVSLPSPIDKPAGRKCVGRRTNRRSPQGLVRYSCSWPSRHLRGIRGAPLASTAARGGWRPSSSGRKGAAGVIRSSPAKCTRGSRICVTSPILRGVA